MEEKKKDHGDEKEKCFVIMPISDQGDYPLGHFTKVYNQIFKPAIEAAGYEPFRVDEDKISDSIINKIFHAVQNCPMAICDLSNRNPNVLYELGIRQAYDKPVVLVQDERTERIFDVSGINTVGYNSDRLFEHVIEARENITEAIISTKEGKGNSLIKMIQVENANIPTGEISEDDRIEIILNGLVNDMQQIKKYIRNEKKPIINLPKVVVEADGYIREYGRRQYVIQLKNGVTNKQIEQTLQKITNLGMMLQWNRSDKILKVVLDNYTDVFEAQVRAELESIGTIVLG